MSEPLYIEPETAGSVSDADRQARIEQLLLDGLDHYFAGKYEQAINIWTRVAFLERGHGRARAYIERARSAVAERQRESEELLHTGVAAYHAEDFQRARELLTRAVADDGSDTARLFLDRLDRLEAVAASAGSHEARLRLADDRSWARYSSRAGWLSVAVVLSAAVVAGLLAVEPLRSWWGVDGSDAASAPSAPTDPLPVARRSTLYINQARELLAAGRSRDAIRVLDRLDAADPHRREVEQLKSEIQRALLAAAAPASPGQTR